MKKEMKGVLPPSRAFKQIKSNVYEATSLAFLQAARRLADTRYITEQELIEVERRYRDNLKLEQLKAKVRDIDSKIAECNEQIIKARNLSIMVELGVDDVTPISSPSGVRR